MALKSKDPSKVRLDVPIEKVEAEGKPKDGKDMVRINFWVTPDVRKKWKQAALDQDKPMSDLIKEAMDAYLRQ